MRRLWFAGLIAAACLLAGAPAVAARSADVVEADVALRLAPDGALLVTERLTFDYDGHFEGSYRDIELRRGERISAVRLSQDGERFQPGGNTALGSDDRPGVFGTVDMGDTYRIVWHYRATDEQRTTEISYRVRDAVIAYADVVDVPWAVWGSEWDFDLDRLRADFANPALDPDDPLYRVWGHPRDVEGETVRGPGRATLEASDVPSGTAVEMRVTMPRPAGPLPAARQGEGEGLPGILAAEKALDEDFNSPWNRFKRFVGDHALVIALVLAALAWLIALVLVRLARERETSVPEYLSEPPDDASPALAYALAHEGGDSDDTVLATLLDLVDRGYYETSQATTEDEKLDLSLEQRGDRPAGELTPYEQDVLAFFDQVLAGERVAMSEMKDRIPQHSEVWRGRWERMTEKLNAAEGAELAWDRDLNGTRWLTVLGSLALFVLTCLLALDQREGWFLPAVVGFFTVVGIAAIPRTRFKRLDAGRIERTERWRAFAHWTEDFPRLSDDPPATLGLWKRILVYGVAFGTATRMIESGRIPEPVIADASGGHHWSSYAMVGGLHGSSFDGSDFSSGFASQVAPQSSSSGGGGGFSGGGGGFSGGGGGGSW